MYRETHRNAKAAAKQQIEDGSLGVSQTVLIVPVEAVEAYTRRDVPSLEKVNYTERGF